MFGVMLIINTVTVIVMLGSGRFHWSSELDMHINHIIIMHTYANTQHLQLGHIMSVTS